MSGLSQVKKAESSQYKTGWKQVRRPKTLLARSKKWNIGFVRDLCWWDIYIQSNLKESRVDSWDMCVCYKPWYCVFRRQKTGKYSEMPVVADIGHMKPIQSENSIHWRPRRDGARSMSQRLAIVNWCGKTGKWQFLKAPPCVSVWGLGMEVRCRGEIGFKRHYSGNFMAT